jgi:hypothetical protein
MYSTILHCNWGVNMALQRPWHIYNLTNLLLIKSLLIAADGRVGFVGSTQFPTDLRA